MSAGGRLSHSFHFSWLVSKTSFLYGLSCCFYCFNTVAGCRCKILRSNINFCDKLDDTCSLYDRFLNRFLAPKLVEFKELTSVSSSLETVEIESFLRSKHNRLMLKLCTLPKSNSEALYFAMVARHGLNRGILYSWFLLICATRKLLPRNTPHSDPINRFSSVNCIREINTSYLLCTGQASLHISRQVLSYNRKRSFYHILFH